MKKKLISLLSLSTLLLVACDDTTEEPTTTNEVSTEETTEEVQESNEPEDNTTDESSEEPATNLAGDEIEEQEGDVVEGDGLTKTITGTNYDINETLSTGDFDITLLNAQLSQVEAETEEMANLLDGENVALVSLEIEVTNNSTDTNAIYPDQAIIVTDNGHQVNANFFLADDVGGDFHGEVTKSGTVFFTFEGNSDEISNVRYIIEAPHDENLEMIGEEIEFSIDF